MDCSLAGSTYACTFVEQLSCGPYTRSEVRSYHGVAAFVDEGAIMGSMRLVRLEWAVRSCRTSSSTEGTLVYSYDSLGRPTRGEFTNGDVWVVYTNWDRLGRPTVGAVPQPSYDPSYAHCGSISLAIAYDDARRTTTETSRNACDMQTITNEFDADGNLLKSTTDPGGGDRQILVNTISATARVCK